MRNSDAIYGGEMSAHHYFRDLPIAIVGLFAISVGILINLQ